jgi:replicative DNA helicase
VIKIDRHTVIQVLGGLMNHPEFLNDIDKYRFELSDFPTSLDKFIFSAINNLYNSGDGANNIRSVDVINYLKNNVSAASLLEEENGETFLQDCETAGDPANFKYYYHKLKKLNFVRDLQKSGRPMDEIYCEDIFNPKYAEINERFEQMTVEDILNMLKMEINGYESKFVLKSVVEESKATDGIEQLIISLKEKPEIGCQL